MKQNTQVVLVKLIDCINHIVQGDLDRHRTAEDSNGRSIRRSPISCLPPPPWSIRSWSKYQLCISDLCDCRVSGSRWNSRHIGRVHDWAAYIVRFQFRFFRPILWGHSGPLCHALSLSLPLWTSILHCRSPGVATVARRLRYSYSWLQLILVVVSTVG